MYKVGEVTSIIKNHVERFTIWPKYGPIDTPDIFLICLPLPGIHSHAGFSNGRCSVILCGEDVAGAPLDLEEREGKEWGVKGVRYEEDGGRRDIEKRVEDTKRRWIRKRKMEDGDKVVMTDKMRGGEEIHNCGDRIVEVLRICRTNASIL